MTTIAAPIRLLCQGFEVDQAADRFGWMRTSIDLVGDARALNERMAEDGYLYLPGLLNRDEILAARRSITERLSAAGELEPGYPIEQCIARTSPGKRTPTDLTKDNAAIAKVVYDGPMIEFFEEFIGEPIRHYDFTWFRAVAPGKGTPSHCDVVYMGRGETQRLYTAWTPYGVVPLEVGGLMVLEGSNRNERLRETYGKLDVDAYCENRPGQRDAWAKGHGGWLAKNAAQIQRSIGGRWLTCPEYHPGDVVIFSVYTVHAGLDNQSDQVRLSSDTRYQPASTPADERWIGPNPPAHGKAGKRSKIC